MYVLASIPKLPCKMSFQLFWVGGFSNLMFFCGSLAQKSSCCFEKKHWEQRESPLPDLLNPASIAYTWGCLGQKKLRDSCFLMQIDFHYCSLPILQRLIILCFFCLSFVYFVSVQYIFVLHIDCYYTLFVMIK